MRPALPRERWPFVLSANVTSCQRLAIQAGSRAAYRRLSGRTVALLISPAAGAVIAVR